MQLIINNVAASKKKRINMRGKSTNIVRGPLVRATVKQP
jgi:hypothetical protein